VTIKFAIQLKEWVVAAKALFGKVRQAPLSATCTGTVANPIAAAGALCVCWQEFEGAKSEGIWKVDLGNRGAILDVKERAAGFYGFGSWAVKGP
jgi:hypothetical protein